MSHEIFFNFLLHYNKLFAVELPKTEKYTNDVIISVESRKGGVGKTTAALSAAKVLAENGYAVLFLDCDITGTSITDYAESPIWKDSIFVLKNNNKAINLLNIFNQYFKTKEMDEMKFESNEIADLIRMKKFIAIGSCIFESKEDFPIDPKKELDNLTVNDVDSIDVYDDLVTTDCFHSSVFVEFLKDLIGCFSNFVNRLKENFPIAIVIDNSPGYIGLSPSIHDWLLKIGPQEGKFLIITSPDSPDVSATKQLVQQIICKTHVRFLAAKALFSLYSDQSTSSIDELMLNPNKNNSLKRIKKEIYSMIESKDNSGVLSYHFPNNDFYKALINNELGELPHGDFYINKSANKYNFLGIIENKCLKKIYENPIYRYSEILSQESVFLDSSLIACYNLAESLDVSKSAYCNQDSLRYVSWPLPFQPKNDECTRFVTQCEKIPNLNLSASMLLCSTQPRVYKPSLPNNPDIQYLITNIHLSKFCERFPKVHEILLGLYKNVTTFDRQVNLILFTIILLNSTDRDIDERTLLNLSQEPLDYLEQIPTNSKDINAFQVYKDKLIDFDSRVKHYSYFLSFQEKIKNIFFNHWGLRKINA